MFTFFNEFFDLCAEEKHCMAEGNSPTSTMGNISSTVSRNNIAGSSKASTYDFLSSEGKVQRSNLLNELKSVSAKGFGLVKNGKRRTNILYRIVQDLEMQRAFLNSHFEEESSKKVKKLKIGASTLKTKSLESNHPMTDSSKKSILPSLSPMTSKDAIKTKDFVTFFRIELINPQINFLVCTPSYIVCRILSTL
jgi:hypothetical protein